MTARQLSDHLDLPPGLDGPNTMLTILHRAKTSGQARRRDDGLWEIVPESM